MRLNKLITIPKEYQDFIVTFEDGTEFDIQSAVKSSSHLSPIIFMQAMHLAKHHDADLCLKAVFTCNSEKPFPLTLDECHYAYNFKFQKDVADKYLGLATTHFFEYLFPKGISPSQAIKNLEHFLIGYVDFFKRTYTDAELVKDTSFICTLYKGFRPIYQNAVLINSIDDEDSNKKKLRRSPKKTPTNKGNKRTGDKDLNNKFDANSPLTRENFQLCEKILKQPAYDLSQFIEKLRFLKKTEYKNNKIDEKALLAALALSPLIQIKFKNCFGVKNDLIFPSEVINLLGKVESSVSLRLTGSGEDDGKSWFEAGKKDVKAGDLSVPIVRFLLQSVTHKNDLFTLDESLIMRAWNKLHLSDEDAKDETSLLDRFYNKNKEINQRENRRAALKGIRKGLDDEIIGMGEAKNALVNIVRDKLEGRPLDQQGPLFIYGASGVGKTSLAKSLVNSLNQYFENNYVLQVFNMELFQREGAEMQLFGSGHQYNIANLGMLTSASEFKPKRVIVFDEIEKAHSNTILSLLSLLSDFKGHDNSSLREVDFSQCIFIFTSNLGQDTCNSDMANQLDFRTVLASAFPPEFVNRISRGYLSYCPSLSESELEQFLTLQAEKLVNQINYAGDGMCLLADHLEIALAALSEELTPRAIMGQTSKIQSLLSNKMDDIEPDEFITLISIELWKPIRLTDFIRDYRSRIWIAKSRFEENKAIDDNNLVLNIYEPKLAIRKEDLQLPFLSFVETSDVNYQDIVGNTKAVETLQRKVRLLKHNETVKNSKSEIAESVNGAILYGEPGAGKTHLARAMANDFEGTFIQVNASELTIGDADKNLKLCFEVANRYAPCILFIDEIDSIASKRQAGRLSTNMMVNSLLTSLDGFKKQEKPVFVVGATNNFDHLDPAVIRPGRLESHIEMNLPSIDDIQQWLNKELSESDLHINETNLISDVCEQLEGLPVLKLNEVIQIAQKIKADNSVTDDLALREAIIRVKYGETDLKKRHPDDITSTAFHEAGHAIATAFLFSVDEIFAVDIRPRKGSAGMVIINSYDQRYANNRAGIRKLIQVCLAGRAAELLYWKSEDMLSVGASSDISKATAYVKTAVTKLGFSLEEHLVDYGQFSVSQSDVQKEVKLWMQDGHTKVTTLLENNWNKVEKLAHLLLKKKCLFKQDLLGMLENESKRKQVH